MSLSLFNLGKLKRTGRPTAEAKRPGTAERPVEAIDPTNWGLVPDAAVSAKPVIDDPAVASAHAAAVNGEWLPAADLLDSVGSDWDRRANLVWLLAGAAADDDTWLTAWTAARPEDPDLAVVRAESLVRLGWQIRGSNRANHTTQSQFAGFHQMLREADKAARTATEVAPEDPTPWVTLLTLARGLRIADDDFTGLWAELVARAPHHRSGHRQALLYWSAKWSGSHEKMLAFANEGTAKTPALSVLPLIAACEMANEVPAVWRTADVARALDALLPWLTDERDRGYPVWDDRGRAAMALVRNDRFAEAVEQFHLLGTRADASYWENYQNPAGRFIAIRALACQGTLG